MGVKLGGTGGPGAHAQPCAELDTCTLLMVLHIMWEMWHMLFNPHCIVMKNGQIYTQQTTPNASALQLHMGTHG